MISDLIFGGNKLAEKRGETDDFWFSSALQRVTSGVDVNEEAALTYSAVFAATRLIAGTAGWLPLNLYKRRSGGGTDIMREDSRDAMVHSEPNDDMTSMSYRVSQVACQVNSGNCFSEIQRVGGGKATKLWPIDKSRVLPMRAKESVGGIRKGDLYYEIRNSGGAKNSVIAKGDMLHVPSQMSDGGIVGRGVITQARESIGFGMATEQHGASTFGDGGLPKAVLTGVPNSIMDHGEKRRAFRSEWREVYGGPDGEKVALMGTGTDLKTLGFSAEDMQFLATRQHNIEEIARWYGVPPHMIGHLLRSTFNNIEVQGQEFVTFSLMQWLKLWEQELNRKLLTPDERRKGYYFKFNVNALLRGDTASRAAFYQSLINTGMMSPNEGRELEDMNPYKGGDVKLIQGAMIPVEDAGKSEPEPTPIPEAKPEEDDDALSALVVELEELRAELAETQDTNRLIAETLTGVSEQVANATGTDEVNELRTRLDEAEAKQKQGALCGLGLAMGSMVRRHARDARKALTSKSFVEWLDGYAGKYRSSYIDNLAQAVQSLAVAGIEVNAEAVVDHHFKTAKEELLEASGAPKAEFEASIEACVLNWEENRAASLSEFALREIEQ